MQVVLSELQSGVARQPALIRDRIAALDGVRAIAILLVLIGHCMLASVPLRNYGSLVGEAGVSIFFVLSGFLVTRVMLLDELRSGRLRLWRFYRRRSLRIFPAFYTFLLFSFALSKLSIVQNADRQTWLASALYFRNMAGSGWNTGHLWSLSLEEQFYAFWPVTFLLLKTKERRMWFILLIIILSVAWRFAWTNTLGYPLPAYAIQHVHYSSDMRIDTFLIGALFAIGNLTWIRSVAPRFVIPFLAIWFENAPFNRTTLPFDTAVTALAVGVLISWLVQTPQCKPSSELSRPMIVYLGKVSYSVYLWQELFLGPHLRWWSFAPLALCVLASYYFVERPFLCWNERLEYRLREYKKGLPCDAQIAM